MKELTEHTGMTSAETGFWTIRRKIVVIAVLFLAVLTGSGIVQYNAINGIRSAWSDYRNRAVCRQELVMEIKTHFGYGGFIHNFKNYVLRGGDEYVKRFEKNRIAVAEAISELKKIATPAEQKAVGDIEKVAGQYVENMKTAIEMKKNGKGANEIDDAVKVDDKPAFEAFEKILGELKAIESGSGDTMESNLDSLIAVYAIVIVCLLVLLLFAVSVLRGIANRLDKVGNFTKRFGEGDLTAVAEVGGTDELGVMACDLQGAVNSLSDIIKRNINMSQNVSESIMALAASFEETSSSLEEMSSMTKQNAENADQVRKLMNETDSVVGRANNEMEMLTASMNEISGAGDEISKIVKTIDEIAFQTNLLSLNAAVEAARAGESGAGFAVVAEEVRNLAMRSAAAAKNTSNLIDGTVKKVGDGSRIVEATNEAFQEVKEYTTKIGALVGEISAATEEQSRGIEQINKAVIEMDRITQQNAADAESLAASIGIFRIVD